MASRSGERRAFALGGLVDVNGVFARRQILQIEGNLYALSTRPVRQFGCSDVFSHGILQHHGYRFIRCKSSGAEEQNPGKTNHSSIQFEPPEQG